MSIRLEMLQVARLAPKLLGESSALVREFLLSQQHEDGGFKDRTGRSDLYYTVFGIDGLLALQAEPPLTQIGHYLERLDGGDSLDFVHLCCLARCHRATLHAPKRPAEAALTHRLVERIEAHRSKDGGYNPLPAAKWGTAYGAFLALSAYQDLGSSLPKADKLVQSFQSLETADGAWANTREGGPVVGSTNATAAVVTVLRNLQVTVNSKAASWLFAQCHPQGGFRAAPNAPIPDLLSTATTLHALAGLQWDLSAIKDSCLDFVDSLWTNKGGFHGHWNDDFLDCEYTFYGLLALGHLSL